MPGVFQDVEKLDKLVTKLNKDKVGCQAAWNASATGLLTLCACMVLFQLTKTSSACLPGSSQ